MSGPPFVNLLGAHSIPIERVETRRRALLRDALAYLQQRREEQDAALSLLLTRRRIDEQPHAR